jgi:hypothetical protein
VDPRDLTSGLALPVTLHQTSRDQVDSATRRRDPMNTLEGRMESLANEEVSS